MSDGRDIIEPRDPEISEKSEIHRKIQQYIGRRYEVYLIDGRIIRGTMLATDKDANMVFNQADERWTNPTMPGVRNLGQAMIAKKYVTRMILLPEPKIIKVEEFQAALTRAEGAVEINGTGEKTEEKKEESKETKI
ncbi:hypothetical protein CAEBREN_06482 [Caenorhabditis brenneri]|uniref:Sm domain-containing protein n=1 Tax=Caenorhabditis brenneri TaxID=135651 RepID=G0P6D5_CAEBE|nr:hypothetical protein CAEBREN_06482 [Caenorhabditis brenneri]